MLLLQVVVVLLPASIRTSVERVINMGKFTLSMTPQKRAAEEKVAAAEAASRAEAADPRAARVAVRARAVRDGSPQTLLGKVVAAAEERGWAQL